MQGYSPALAVAHCGPIPMTCGSCLCHERITNSVIGVSRPPVLDCGTTFHPDYGGRDLPSTLSDNFWKLAYLATEALSDSFEFIGAIEISLSVYLYKATKPIEVTFGVWTCVDPWIHRWGRGLVGNGAIIDKSSYDSVFFSCYLADSFALVSILHRLH